MSTSQNGYLLFKIFPFLFHTHRGGVSPLGPHGALLGRYGWPGNGKVAPAPAGVSFWELPGTLLGGKVDLAREGAGFPGLPKIWESV